MPFLVIVFSFFIFHKKLCSIHLVSLAEVRKAMDSTPSKETPSELMNYYALLGVPVDVSFEDVYSRYRKLSREWHPDGASRRAKKRRLGDVEQNNKRWNLLCEAKDTLTDEEQRKAYNLKLFGDERKKWIGSESRDFEDIFYHDMQTKTSKGHTEKVPPTVVRKRLSLAQWMHPCPEGILIEYDKQTLCSSCYGYQQLPRSKEGEKLTFPREWNPEFFTMECPACTGTGFTLKDSTLQSRKRKAGEEVDHCTPEGYSTTITAAILSCSRCMGKKRIFHAERESGPFELVDCTDCKATGTRFDRCVPLCVPYPRHFDAETRTSILVLIGEGNQLRANQTPGDVHVIFDLVMPRGTMRLDETERAMERRVPSSSVPTSQATSEEEFSEEVEEEVPLHNLPPLRNPYAVVKEMPMELAVTKDGKHFALDCSINLRQAICGFSIYVPSYWTSDPQGLEEFNIPLGMYTWTGDIWNVNQIGPPVCDLCDMPAFLWPARDDGRSRGCFGQVEKINGKYPGFAPCLVAKRQCVPNGLESHHDGVLVMKWVFYGCGVAHQRYPEHPQNALISMHRPIDPRDSGTGEHGRNESERLGSLRINYTVSAPAPQMDNPDMFYRAFSWCCGKLDRERPCTVYSCS
jgi:DnaJ-class molecular chaperone